MAIPFSEAEKLLSKSMRKVKAESDLDRKAIAVEEMSLQAMNLGTHIFRFANIAWILDTLCFLFAFLVFCGMLYFEIIEDFLSPGICQVIGPFFRSEGFRNEIAWLVLCIPGLLTAQTVFDLILSAVCEHTPVTVRKYNDVVRPNGSNNSSWVFENVHYVEDMLSKAANELTPTFHVSFELSNALCLISAIPVAVKSLISDMEYFLAYIALTLFAVGVFLLTVALKKLLMELFFSSWKNRRQAKKLRDEFSAHMAEYQKECEKKKRLADDKLGAELYKEATMGRIVDESLMVQAAERGNPQAKLYMGRQILKRTEDERFTYSEVKELCKRAIEYLEFSDIPDAKLLCALAQAKSEGHTEYEWKLILQSVQLIDKTKLSRECRDIYDEVVERLINNANLARSAVTPSVSDVARRLGGGGSGGGFGSEWSRMNDDIDAARRAASITKEYGPGWRGYDAEAPIQDTEALGPDPEAFPDSSDIW